jgi:hypothetical protein
VASKTKRAQTAQSVCAQNYFWSRIALNFFQNKNLSNQRQGFISGIFAVGQFKKWKALIFGLSSCALKGSAA